uniref:Uncharacterized protein n=1 Tax=Rhizophagus irregularis (strain DAOM 181602 / DAOM 197198 / MUCL 43194) TaxID=747089 RepID=U9U7I4_RHIID
MTSDAIARLIADFNDLKEKCAHQVEENQNLKQKNQNLQQEIQILKEKLQEKDKQLELQKSLGKNTEKSGIYSDIQVVVGLDFGSASYARSLHKVGKQGIFRSNSYQQDNKILKQNVYKTLCCDTQFSNYLKIVELYKLRLGNLSDSNSKSNSYLYEYDLLRNIGKTEAAATYCIKNELQKYNLLSTEDANLDNRSINFGLSFGPNKITAFAIRLACDSCDFDRG